MADAVILRWLKSPGQAFERGEGLIEVETDKATVVYEAEAGGTLGSILAPEGTTVAVGAPIATLVNGDTAAAPEPQSGDRTAGVPSERDAGRSADGGRARRLAPRHRRHRARRTDHRRGRPAGRDGPAHAGAAATRGGRGRRASSS